MHMIHTMTWIRGTGGDRARQTGPIMSKRALGPFPRPAPTPQRTQDLPSPPRPGESPLLPTAVHPPHSWPGPRPHLSATAPLKLPHTLRARGLPRSCHSSPANTHTT